MNCSFTETHTDKMVLIRTAIYSYLALVHHVIIAIYLHKCTAYTIDM